MTILLEQTKTELLKNGKTIDENKKEDFQSRKENTDNE